MSSTSGVRRLRPDDTAALVALRREALEREPLAFAASLEDDRGLVVESVRAGLADEHGAATFGYFDGATLTGIIGVGRLARVKQRHKAVVWGLYVVPAARGKGVGRALLEAAVTHARGWPGVEQVQLSVSETAAAARRLYERAGFRVWGRERRALQWEGRVVDEEHLVLDIARSSLTPSRRGA